MRRKTLFNLIFCLGVLLWAGSSVQAQTVFQSPLDPKLSDGTLRAFPTAEGYGAKSTGGRGGGVCKVTTLDDAAAPPAGSLRQCIENGTYPQNIVFEVSGEIDCIGNGNIDMTDTRNGLSIIGATAPGEGIAIYGCGVQFGGQNVITRDVTFQYGQKGTQRSIGDPLEVDECRDCIFDHVTARWGQDELFQNFLDNPVSQRVTVQWSLFYEALDGTFDLAEPNHGYGPLIANGGLYSWLNNIMAHNRRRNPRFARNDGGVIDVYNNIVHNFGQVGMHWNDDSGTDVSTGYNVQNNVFRRGPSTSANAPAFEVQGTSQGADTIYLDGNIYTNLTSADDNIQAVAGDCSGITNPPADVCLRNSIPASVLKGTQVATVAWAQLDSDYVGLRTGAQVWQDFQDGKFTYGHRAPARPTIDQNAQNQVFNGTGAIIDCEDKEETSQIVADGCAVESSYGSRYPYTQTTHPATRDQDNDAIPDSWEVDHCPGGDCARDGADLWLAAGNTGTGWTNLEYYFAWASGDFSSSPPPGDVTVDNEVVIDEQGCLHFIETKTVAQFGSFVTDEEVFCEY